MKRILTVAALLTMVFTLSACQLFAHDYKEDVHEYAMIISDGSELAVLEQYPNLEYVDLRGSTCFEDILEYAAANPNVKVRFNIPLGAQNVNLDVENLTLVGSDGAFGDLISNLKFLQKLQKVHLDQISITKEQLDELKAAYPHIDFTYTVKLGDKLFDPSVTKLDLSQISSEDAQIALAALGHLPNLRQVDLVESSGKTNLSVADCNALMNAYPHIDFHYKFELFGQTLSPETEAVTFKDVKIGRKGLDQLREAFSVMPKCTYVCLDNCGIEDEDMAKFRAEFPEKAITWRIFVGKYSVLTDTEVILMPGVSQTEADSLQYCTNVKYLDMTGCKIRDFSFLAGMTGLECVVLQQTPISDLSVLQNAPKLTWLNLANCTGLTDLAPLSGMANLKYLNLSATKIKDLTPLDQIPIERLKCAKTSFSNDMLETFATKHPNCLVTKTGTLVGKGWHYDDAAQRKPFSYYAEMMTVFGYKK